MNQVIGPVTHSLSVVNRFGQSFHVACHPRTNGGTTGEEQIGDHNFSFEIIPGNRSAFLIGEFEVFDFMPHGIGLPLSSFHYFPNGVCKKVAGHDHSRFTFILDDKIGHQG